jgi:hypothetical protein
MGLTPVPTWLVDFEGGGAATVAGVAVVVAGSLVLIAGGRRWRGAALLWAAHVGLLIPMLGLSERPHFAADRYHYLAGVVMALTLALLLARTAVKFRMAVALVAGTGLMALGVAQRGQLSIWANTDTLMQRIVDCADHPGVRRTYQERWVRDHLHRGELAQAAELAARIGIPLPSLAEPVAGGLPLLATLHLRLALDFRRAGRRIEAHEHFRETLQLAPDWSEAAYHWAWLHASDRAPLEGLRWYRQAVRPGRGNPVPLGARQQLLSVIAEGFFSTQRALLATRTIELALREGGGAGADPDLEKQLRTQLARFAAPPGP